MGTGLVYMAAKSLYRTTRPPLVLGGLMLLWGYLSAWRRRVPRYENPEFRRFLRRYQWRCLLLGKRRATKQIHDRIRNGASRDAASRPQGSERVRAG